MKDYIMIDWQLAEAKNKFSEVMTLALANEPQKICRRHQSVIIISQQEHNKLINKNNSFVEYLTKSPSFEDLDLLRDTSKSREFTL